MKKKCNQRNRDKAVEATRAALVVWLNEPYCLQDKSSGGGLWADRDIVISCPQGYQVQLNLTLDPNDCGPGTLCLCEAMFYRSPTLSWWLIDCLTNRERLGRMVTPHLPPSGHQAFPTESEIKAVYEKKAARAIADPSTWRWLRQDASRLPTVEGKQLMIPGQKTSVTVSLDLLCLGRSGQLVLLEEMFRRPAGDEWSLTQCAESLDWIKGQLDKILSNHA